MTDKLISFETAKLAKEKGFNIPVNGVYVDKCTDCGARTYLKDNGEVAEISLIHIKRKYK